MQAVKIKENAYWVGVKDWNLREFHGYNTPRGSTYNSYLLKGGSKTVLVDTVKEYLSDEFFNRVRTVTPLDKIDYIIVDHVEMDHTGALPKAMQLCPNAVIFTSAKGEEGLRKHFDAGDWKIQKVKTGDVIDIGGMTLSFIGIPMVHWPDSQMTYIKELKLLLPNDAFGQHYAASHMFDDQNEGVVMDEAAKYYANIVMPYAKSVQGVYNAVSKLDIDMIGPSHGVIWCKNISRIAEKYKMWAANGTAKKAVVVYDTMWGSTEKIARAIAGAFEDAGFETVSRNLRLTHIAEVMQDMLEASHIAIGSPTLNNKVLPTVGGFMTYMTGLRPLNRTGVLFGSYGWNPDVLKSLEADLTALGWQLPLQHITSNYIPGSEQLMNIYKTVKGLF